MSDREDKKSQFVAEKKGGAGKKAAIIAAVVLVVAVVAGGTLFGTASSTRYEEVRANSGMISFPLAEISDGKAHYFSLASGNGSIDFFVLKDNQGVVRAAFDACDVCYKAKKGYRQEGDMMVCNNCNMKFRSDRINVISGGCNPAPLNRKVQGNDLVIAEVDVKKGAWYFGL